MSDPTLLVLASLADGEKHGYAMMEDIQRFAHVRLGPGTLYGAITSTNSVRENGSVVYWRILAVYASSFFCGAAAGTGAGALAGFLSAAESVTAIRRQIAILRMIKIITQNRGLGAMLFT